MISAKSLHRKKLKNLKVKIYSKNKQKVLRNSKVLCCSHKFSKFSDFPGMIFIIGNKYCQLFPKSDRFTPSIFRTLSAKPSSPNKHSSSPNLSGTNDDL